MSVAVLAPDERKLARHALGFDQGVGESYRNRYFTIAGGAEAIVWDDMVARGLAKAGDLTEGGSRWYAMTYAGAVAACDPGEGLCPEDFPYSERDA